MLIDHRSPEAVRDQGSQKLFLPRLGLSPEVLYTYVASVACCVTVEMASRAAAELCQSVCLHAKLFKCMFVCMRVLVVYSSPCLPAAGL